MLVYIFIRENAHEAIIKAWIINKFYVREISNYFFNRMDKLLFLTLQMEKLIILKYKEITSFAIY